MKKKVNLNSFSKRRDYRRKLFIHFNPQTKVVGPRGIDYSELDFDPNQEIENSDITLIFNKEKYPVHKCILSSHSKFFHTMFNGGFNECKKESIDLMNVHDVPTHIFSKFLSFFYNYPIEIEEEDMEKIFLLGNMYQFEAVCMKCIERCRKEIQKGYANEKWMYNALKLAKDIGDFDLWKMCLYHFSFVTKKRELCTLIESKELFLEILQSPILCMNEKYVVKMIIMYYTIHKEKLSSDDLKKFIETIDWELIKPEDVLNCFKELKENDLLKQDECNKIYKDFFEVPKSKLPPIRKVVWWYN